MKSETIRQKIKAFIGGIGKVFYPPRCIFCRKLLEHDEICYECRSSLPFLQNMRVEAPNFIEEAYAPLYYENQVRRAIIDYKFHHAAAYAKPLAEMIRMCVELHLAGRFDYITWVPISARRMRHRGYDQSFLLAKDIAEYLRIPLVATLRKTRHNSRQSSKKTVAARRANVIGVYQICNRKEIEGKRILIIDDILTTGATLSECARMLKTAGAASLYSVVIAKTRKRKKKN